MTCTTTTLRLLVRLLIQNKKNSFLNKSSNAIIMKIGKYFYLCLSTNSEYPSFLYGSNFFFIILFLNFHSIIIILGEFKKTYKNLVSKLETTHSPNVIGRLVRKMLIDGKN